MNARGEKEAKNNGEGKNSKMAFEFPWDAKFEAWH